MLKGIVKGAKNLLNLDRAYSDTRTLDGTKWYPGAVTQTTSSPSLVSANIQNNVVSVTSFGNGYGACFIIPVEQTTSYSISMNTSKQSSGSYFAYAFLNAEGSILYSNTSTSTSTTISTYSDTAYLNLCLRFPVADGEVMYSNIMVNEGSTPLPYEPYQTIHDITRIPMRSKNLFEGTISAVETSAGIKNGLNFYGVGTYTVSAGGVAQDGDYCYAQIYHNGNYSASKYITVNSTKYTQTFTLTDGDKAVIFSANNNESLSTSTAKFERWKIMLNEGSTALPYVPYGMVEGWEVRDQQGRIIWGADKTLTGTDSITYKGYGLDIKEYDIDGNMVQAAEKEYSITGTSPLDFQSNGSNATISISGNETQASNQAYTTSDTSPLSFNADGTNLTALSMDGNMNQASSQPYTVSGTSPISFMNNGTAIDYTVSGNMNQSGTPTSPITPQECGERTNQLIPYPYYSPDDVYDGVTFTTNGNKIVASGTTSTGYNFFLWRVDKFPAGTYTLSVIGTHTGASIYVRDVTNSATIVSIFGGQTGDRQVSFTTTEELQVYVYINSSGSGTVDFDCSIMLNEGSTALPYEPNLYKVPLTIAGNTQNIYIKEPLRKIGDYSDTVNSDGSVERKIKKVTFDGTETWTNTTDSVYIASSNLGSIPQPASNSSLVCSHLPNDTSGMVNGNTWFFRCYYTTSIQTWKSYLTSEYSAGHPVEVWYVLATPQTDTATVPTITPTSGNNTLSVDTTLSPSNITITSNSSVFPGNPITPIECGVKTENLTDQEPITSTAYYAIITSGDLLSKILSLEAGEEYSLSWDYRSNATESSTGLKNTIVICNSSYASIKTISNGSSFSLTATDISNVFGVIGYFGQDCTDGEMSNIMLNTGSAALTYEPYGKYKIPITVGSTTNNIFINQPIRKIGNYSDSIGSDGVVTRNIKKLVFDGTENWFAKASSSSPQSLFYFTVASISGKNQQQMVCSHVPSINGIPSNEIGIFTDSTYNVVYINVGRDIMDAQPSGNTVNGLKEYFAAQYSAGTPVTIWYVLATPDTTETTTIPTISTVNGANTLTTQTAITPSNITISTSSSVYPKNPIYPEECGDKTANLFDGTYTLAVIGGSSGNVYSTSTAGKTAIIPCNPNTEYTVKKHDSSNRFTIAESNSIPQNQDTVAIIYNNGNANEYTFTTSASSKYLLVYVSTSTQQAEPRLMVNLGSTTLPYEPYGYKIPITIGSNTNYIYTKEPIRKIGNYADVVNSDGSITRNIYKLVLTGSESWTSGNNCYYTWLSSPKYNPPAQSIIVCSHYVGSIPRYRDELPDKQCMITINQNQLAFKDSSFADLTAFQQFVTTQNSSGTPITVWYVMQTPTTEQTTIPTLTTVDGKNTATIGTTLAPSSITINATSKVYPNNPIIPEECGDLTENLFNINGTWIKQLESNVVVVDGDSVTITSAYYAGRNITLKPNTNYSIEFSTTKTSLQGAVYGGQISGTPIKTIYSNFVTFNTGEYSNIYIIFYSGQGTMATETFSNIMLVEGEYTSQTMPSYEPYGKYKVPIINNGVTKNIYLNQPIRKIGDYSDVINSDGTVSRHVIKIEITGDESIVGYEVVSGTALVKKLVSGLKNTPQGYGQEMISSHFESAKIESTLSAGKIFNRSWSYYNLLFGFDPAVITSLQDARDYFNAQITAGHPVEIWYVSATPETESITTPIISTIEGTNTIEVDTTLSPSKIDITGHIKATQ